MGRGHEGHWANGVPCCRHRSFTPSPWVWICLFALCANNTLIRRLTGHKSNPGYKSSKGSMSCSILFPRCHQDDGIRRMRISGDVGGDEEKQVIEIFAVNIAINTFHQLHACSRPGLEPHALQTSYSTPSIVHGNVITNLQVRKVKCRRHRARMWQ